jgi:hypothetical protein
VSALASTAPAHAEFAEGGGRGRECKRELFLGAKDNAASEKRAATAHTHTHTHPARERQPFAQIQVCGLQLLVYAALSY